MNRRLIRSVAGLAVLAGLLAASACGQSGPLYLPHRHPAPPHKHPVPAPATAASSATPAAVDRQ